MIKKERSVVNKSHVRKEKKKFLFIYMCKRKVCIKGFLCVNDAWKGILVCVSNECI